jgi:hypothetical protein
VEPSSVPVDGLHEETIWQKPKEIAAVEVKRFAHVAEGIPNGRVNLVDWEVDELD